MRDLAGMWHLLEISIDHDELVKAGWFSVSEL